MPDAYVIEVSGRTAVARDSHTNSFNFFSAAPRFNAIEGQCFSDPLAAERAARMLAKYGSLLQPPRVRRQHYETDRAGYKALAPRRRSAHDFQFNSWEEARA